MKEVALPRVPVALFGLVGLVWSLLAIVSFWMIFEERIISAQILADGRFKRGVLADALSRMEAKSPPLLHPDFARAKALITLRVGDEAVAEDVSLKGAAKAQRLRSALAVNPADSFLWLMLYLVEVERNGFDVSKLPYLEQSYAMGPREDWITVRRNRIALATFAMLSDAMQERVVSEFAALVGSDLIENAAVNLLSVGRPQRDRLLASLSSTDIMLREALMKRLLRDGVKVNVPGVVTDEWPRQ
ncbi:hypothetical protein I6F09_15125 [Bradyrhizobium sp. IC3195]|uniref:hypothetical protein n=1 Tax=Bradyrhizobium sp. IC3195 TaxID=2793804 RepID=UPI001CD43404|nr:hypothetical protein [Bradyrhizobium sp. IC3195]MCA1469226.1 hypothetical protein [Bradyrhizobium sp. IC3195]